MHSTCIKIRNFCRTFYTHCAVCQKVIKLRLIVCVYILEVQHKPMFCYLRLLVSKCDVFVMQAWSLKWNRLLTTRRPIRSKFVYDFSPYPTENTVRTPWKYLSITVFHEITRIIFIMRTLKTTWYTQIPSHTCINVYITNKHV